MQEIELIPLPDAEQVSDDFMLYTHDGEYYAIRTRLDNDKLSFCLQDKTKWGAISKAVSAIHFHIIRTGAKPRVPNELKAFYVKAETAGPSSST